MGSGWWKSKWLILHVLCLPACVWQAGGRRVAGGWQFAGASRGLGGLQGPPSGRAKCCAPEMGFADTGQAGAGGLTCRPGNRQVRRQICRGTIIGCLSVGAQSGATTPPTERRKTGIGNGAGLGHRAGDQERRERDTDFRCAGDRYSAGRWRKRRGAAALRATAVRGPGSSDRRCRPCLDRRVEVAPYASWGSWIEGVPFSHVLLLNDGVLVDLAPCRTEADFVRNYRCSPDQFMDLTRRVIKTRGEIHFNIRDYDPTRPESLEGYRCGSGVSAPRRGWRAADRRWPRHRRRAALQAAGPRRPDPVPRHRPRRPSPRA